MNAVATMPAAPESAGSTRETVRAALADLSRRTAREGLPAIELEGRLIRPLAAYAAARGLGTDTDDRFWAGVLAVQLAHEASLVHDDIIDGAVERRGRPTLASSAGMASALVHGDHLLTASYRLVCRTGSLELVTLFSRAVERTVAAEIEQGRTLGTRLDPAACRRIAEGKAGELLGFAMAVAPAVAGQDTVMGFFRLGKSLGLLYQMLDDLLDYCPSADTGKPALGDHSQRRWTWPLALLPDDPMQLPADEVVAALCRPGDDGASPLQSCLGTVERSARTLVSRASVLMPGDTLLAGMVEEWIGRARGAVEREMALRASRSRTPHSTVSATLRLRLPENAADGWFASSRTFRFAARLLPPAQAVRVARVYAYCRALDDLIDDAGMESRDRTEALLDEWLEHSEAAYRGSPRGLAVIDEAMADMRGAGVPFHYASALVEGMRMDLRDARYETLVDLRGYSYRVASVVGLWLTRLFGTHDPAVLDDAARLGEAMQLTNILRDVGEDWDRGRLYLPREVLDAHGLRPADIGEMREGTRPIGPEYRALLEHLMAVAEADYERAFRAIPALPPFFRGPVAVSARLYRGIHASIRRNDYDNLSRRAFTRGPMKIALAARALWDLRLLPRHLAPASARPRTASGVAAAPAGWG